MAIYSFQGSSVKNGALGVSLVQSTSTGFRYLLARCAIIIYFLADRECYLKLSMVKVRDVSNAYFKLRFSFFFFGACLQVDLNNSPPESHSLTHPCIHIALLCKQNTEGHHDTTYSNIRAFPFTCKRQRSTINGTLIPSAFSV